MVRMGKSVVIILVILLNLVGMMLAEEWVSDWSNNWSNHEYSDTVYEVNSVYHRCGIRFKNQQLTVFSECRFDAPLLKEIGLKDQDTSIQWKPDCNYIRIIYPTENPVNGQRTIYYELGSLDKSFSVTIGDVGYWEYTAKTIFPQAGNRYRYGVTHRMLNSESDTSWMAWSMGCNIDQVTFDIDFSGPSEIEEGHAGTFTASYNPDICPPSLFRWYKQDLGYSMSENGLKKPLPIEDANFVLLQEGNDLNSITVPTDGGSYRLKLVVENTSNHYQEEAIRTINVIDRNSDETVSKIDEKTPIQLSISSSPNPFNQIAEIQYALPNQGPVNMVIYNLMGETVKELTHATLESGIHRVAWDGTDRHGQKVKSGVYFCRILTNQGAAVAKILCTR